MTAAHIVPSPLREPPPLSSEARNALDLADRTRQERAKAHAAVAIAEYKVAASLARKVYPSPIARLIVEALDWWCEIGHRFDVSAPTAALYEQVMADAAEKGLT